MPTHSLKKTIVAIGFLFVACNSGAQKETNNSQADVTKITYSKNDLAKIKWIEGKWRGMAGDKPFYEMYEMINDSCILITSFDWNGTDSSNTSVDKLQWKDGAYYLGKEQNYKVTAITNEEIKMIPIKANNDIRWKFRDSSSWDVTLVGKKSTARYLMQKFDPFKK